MAEIKRRGAGKKEEIYVSTVLPNGVAITGNAHGEVTVKMFGNRPVNKATGLDEAEAVQIRLIGRENIADVRDCLTALLEQADSLAVLQELERDEKPVFVGIDQTQLRALADALKYVDPHMIQKAINDFERMTAKQAPSKVAPPPIKRNDP